MCESFDLNASDDFSPARDAPWDARCKCHNQAASRADSNVLSGGERSHAPMKNPKISPSADGAPEPLHRVAITPRLLRLRDVPRYLGMDKNRFNREVRPQLTVIPIGKEGIAFDRLDLDAWVDEYKRRNGRPVANKLREARMQPSASREAEGGRSSTSSSQIAFRRAVERAISKRP